MAVKIEVEQVGPDEFHVRLTEGKTETRHVVTMKTSEYERYLGQ